MNDSALQTFIGIFSHPLPNLGGVCLFFFFVCVYKELFYFSDSHNKRTSDNIWSVITIHDLGGRKPSFSFHIQKPSKACTIKWSDIPVILREQFNVC